MSYTLRFSALASCVALPPASMQSSVRDFDALYAGFAGTKTGHKKTGLIEAPMSYLFALILLPYATPLGEITRIKIERISEHIILEFT